MFRVFLTLLATFILPAAAMASGDGATAATGALGLKAVGAGLAIGLTGLGTGVAMSRIGSAGVGAVTEDQKNFGTALVLLVIPESILIFGFVIAFLIK
jgi:V/A-type H+-transporting ATPase subunit K